MASPVLTCSSIPLPDELRSHILTSYITSAPLSTLCILARCSKATYGRVMPILYSTVELDKNNAEQFAYGLSTKIHTPLKQLIKIRNGHLPKDYQSNEESGVQDLLALSSEHRKITLLGLIKRLVLVDLAGAIVISRILRIYQLLQEIWFTDKPIFRSLSSIHIRSKFVRSLCKIINESQFHSNYTISQNKAKVKSKSKSNYKKKSSKLDTTSHRKANLRDRNQEISVSAVHLDDLIIHSLGWGLRPTKVILDSSAISEGGSRTHHGYLDTAGTSIVNTRLCYHWPMKVLILNNYQGFEDLPHISYWNERETLEAYNIYYTLSELNSAQEQEELKTKRLDVLKKALQDYRMCTPVSDDKIYDTIINIYSEEGLWKAEEDRLEWIRKNVEEERLRTKLTDRLKCFNNVEMI
ncbi:uncharacterized protein IL334_001441 [Kwoniella shivajii]|uniref:F-box domain-containing protein n=1 Tax=Kwoniella shivajii TaxID=564305 RepID=A0ABZ1CRW9_9TREE|nr:hypothetical protein IL334_001441 [Kwoniella shivajii]